MRSGVLNLHDLLYKPYGSGAAALDPQPLLADLRTRYMQLSSKPRLSMAMRNAQTGEIAVHVKIPSEHVRDFTYDVVMAFTPRVDGRYPRSLFYWPLQVYSNSPAFTFTYAYVTNKNNWLVSWLTSHVGSYALKEPPIIRNPVEILGLEKTIVFAAYFMKDSGYLDVSAYASASRIGLSAWNTRTMVDGIDTNDKKIKDRTAAEQRLRVQRARDRSKAKSANTLPAERASVFRPMFDKKSQASGFAPTVDENKNLKKSTTQMRSMFRKK
jgi:CRISPR/Cas system CMR-associated protein Cmr5 small subunit